nr:PREDICTED: uncharacterized protein LOC108822033 [Raphanus sativus]
MMSSPASGDHGDSRERSGPEKPAQIDPWTPRSVAGRMVPRWGPPMRTFERRTMQCEWVEDLMRGDIRYARASTEYQSGEISGKRGRGRSRKEKPVSDMEWVSEPLVEEPSKKKRGHPRKFSAPRRDAFVESQEPGSCDVPVQTEKKPRTVRDYLKEFMDTAKKCKSKPAEEWCQLFMTGLRKDIQD